MEPLKSVFKNLAPLLKPEEEAELAKKVQEGDEEAKQKFIEANIRLLISVAQKHAGKLTRSMELGDLISEGYFGLRRAVELFQAEKGKFSTYGYYGTEQYVRRALADQGNTIRIPPSAQREKASAKCKDLKEKATNFTTSAEDLNSIPAPEMPEEDPRIMEAIETLDPRSQKIILESFGFRGEEKTYEEIGKGFSPPLSKERVRQLRLAAMEKLKSYLTP